MRGGAKTKDKRQRDAKGQRRINSQCESTSQRVRIALSRDGGPRETERWNRSDESFKSTIYLS